MGTIVSTLQPTAQVYRTPSIGGDPGEIPLLPPGGQAFALVSTNSTPQTTRIYTRTGTLVTAVTGKGIVWMDDNRLLTYDSLSTPSGQLFSATGSSLGTVNLPAMGNVNVVGTDGLYSTVQNSIYSVTTGNVTWTGSFPAALDGAFGDNNSRLGSVASGYVVYLSGHEVIAEPH